MSDPQSKPEAKSKGKGINWVLVLVPIALIAAAVLAFALPPTHAALVNGPLKPLFARIGLAPATQVAARAKPVDPAADIKRLNDQLETDRKAANEKDARIAQLTAQVAKLQAPPSSAASPASTPKPSPAPVSQDVKRAAVYWAGMDAEKAADIAAQLPNDYVKEVFGQMPADSVAEIMNALPAKTAAKLTADPAPAKP